MNVNVQIDNHVDQVNFDGNSQTEREYMNDCQTIKKNACLITKVKIDVLS